jgi:hypothetical protein
MTTLCINLLFVYDHNSFYTSDPALNEMLEMACLVGQDAVNATPIDDFLLPSRLEVLSKALIRRGSMQDLSRAILHCNEAIKLTAKDAPKRAVLLLTLGTAFMCRSGPSKSLEDLNNSIDAYEKALGIVPESSPRYIGSAKDALERLYDIDSNISEPKWISRNRKNYTSVSFVVPPQLH